MLNKVECLAGHQRSPAMRPKDLDDSCDRAWNLDGQHTFLVPPSFCPLLNCISQCHSLFHTKTRFHHVSKSCNITTTFHNYPHLSVEWGVKASIHDASNASAFRSFPRRVRYVSDETWWTQGVMGMGLRFRTSHICCSQECLKRSERSCQTCAKQCQTPPKTSQNNGTSMGRHVKLCQVGHSAVDSCCRSRQH